MSAIIGTESATQMSNGHFGSIPYKGPATTGASAKPIPPRNSAMAKLRPRIRSGTVKVNAGPALDAALPFGGMKNSGWGRENGKEGVLAFTELKTVAMKLA